MKLTVGPRGFRQPVYGETWMCSNRINLSWTVDEGAPLNLLARTLAHETTHVLFGYGTNWNVNPRSGTGGKGYGYSHWRFLSESLAFYVENCALSFNPHRTDYTKAKMAAQLKRWGFKQWSQTLSDYSSDEKNEEAISRLTSVGFFLARWRPPASLSRVNSLISNLYSVHRSSSYLSAYSIAEKRAYGYPAFFYALPGVWQKNYKNAKYLEYYYWKFYS